MALSKGPLGPLSRAERAQKVTPVLQESKCIAAIDFGTSSLSVAYTSTNDGLVIRLLPLHSTYERVPNAILISKDQENRQCKVIGIGYKAQSIYSDLKKGAENFIYFERIKNLLERDKVSSCTLYTLYTILIIRN